MQLFRQDLISIAITFAFGVFVGGYLYLGSFAPLLAELSVRQSGGELSWQLTGERLGDCQTGCPSVRIARDGSYRFRYYDAASGETVIREGVLPLVLARDLRRHTTELIDTLFVRTSRAVVCGAPEIATGNESRFRLRYQGETYEFDTCGLRSSGEVLSTATVAALWEYLVERWGA